MWSFVRGKLRKKWLWLAQNRRTRQVVAFFIGDRSKESCRKLWQSIPQDYQYCYSYSDFLEAYQQVFGDKKHTFLWEKLAEKLIM
jgi:insertion element IS1 protein InsB